MGSNLSKGTKNFPDYNQATRNIVCIAHSTLGLTDCNTFFYVVAPEKNIIKHELRKQIEIKKVIDQIEKRYKPYEGKDISKEKMLIIVRVKKCDIKVITYEDWISKITNTEAQKKLSEFYNAALYWNKIKKQ